MLYPYCLSNLVVKKNFEIIKNSAHHTNFDSNIVERFKKKRKKSLEKSEMATIDIDALQTTNFEFDIEANRRRRAELANDVTELISISKFFLQHYSSADDLPAMPINPLITKREKNEANVNRARGRSNGRTVQTKKSPVANATPAHVKRKHTRINNGRVARTRDTNNDVPPLFDKIKLHEYCVDVVDRFFHGPPPNDSEISDSPKNGPTTTVKKTASTEKSIQITNNANGNEIVLSKPKKVSKYATIPSRYMNQTPQKSINSTNKNASPYRLVSAKSREILEEVARKGTEIKRHSCLIHKKETTAAYRDTNQYYTRHNRSEMKFSDIHPDIELVPSNAFFPKRILKQTSISQESPVSKEKIDEKENEKEPSEKSHSSANSVITVENSIQEKPCNNKKTSTERECVQSKSTEQIPSKSTPKLNLLELPVFSIKPKVKCEIENVYEIEIKPDDAKPSESLFKDKNKVIEVVYECSEQEAQQEIVNAAQTSNQNQTNKYLAQFSNDGRTAERSYDENVTTDETQETQESSHLSLNLSTSSHMTDDEKFQSDKKIPAKNARIPKTAARSVIDKILEIEGIAESNEEAASNQDEPKLCTIEAPPKVQQRSDNFDDLREILRKIRSDKTTLDVALDTIEPPDFPATPHTMTTNREVQCNESDLNSPKIDGGKKTSLKATDLCIHSPHQIDSSLMESPKFNKTIESIRSSARKLDFSINDSEYRPATRDQIEKAAKKFLKSILKNADENSPLSASERENSSYIGLKVEKQKYHIIDDQIIQSNFNVKSDRDYTSASSTSSDVTSLQLRLPSARLQMDCAKIENHKWSEPSDSDFTNSMEKFINNYRPNEQNLPQRQLMSNVIHNINNYSDLSDGEILSDGEFHLPQL